MENHYKTLFDKNSKFLENVSCKNQKSKIFFVKNNERKKKKTISFFFFFKIKIKKK
jgi:hypothetical protein